MAGGEVLSGGVSSAKRHPGLRHVPFVLEIPGFDRQGPDRKNLGRATPAPRAGRPVDAFVRRHASAHDPAAADGEHLPNKAVGGAAAQVGRKLGVFARGHQPAQRHLSRQPLLESGVGLDLRREYVGLSTKFCAIALTWMFWGASSTPTACT